MRMWSLSFQLRSVNWTVLYDHRMARVIRDWRHSSVQRRALRLRRSFRRHAVNADGARVSRNVAADASGRRRLRRPTDRWPVQTAFHLATRVQPVAPRLLFRKRPTLTEEGTREWVAPSLQSNGSSRQYMNAAGLRVVCGACLCRLRPLSALGDIVI